MRWSSSSVRMPATRRCAAATAVAMAVVLGAACSTKSTRYWVPSAENPRWTPEQATEVLERYLQVQCGQLREARKPDTGESLATVQVDTAGLVTRASLGSSTGDETLDGLLGTIAAQLVLPAGGSAERKVLLGYSCGASGAVVGTVHPQT